MRQERIYKNLRVRSGILRLIRRFFFEREYIEVETPIRLPAPIPEAHIEPVESEKCILQASPELCMKQLLAAGYGKIFQIARVFRKGERGAKHLPELTMLEWYAPGESYYELMVMLETLIHHIGMTLNGKPELNYNGQSVDLTLPFDRLTVSDAFKKYSGLSVEEALETGTFDEIMGLSIEPNLGLSRPVFLYDYPVEKGSLSRRKPEDDSLAERTELYISGVELCNGFSELTDPVEQRLRFEAEQKIRSDMGGKIWPLPETFLKRLSLMPESAGMAVGIDRLVMLFTDTKEIDDVVAFTPEDLEAE